MFPPCPSQLTETNGKAVFNQSDNIKDFLIKYRNKKKLLKFLNANAVKRQYGKDLHNEHNMS